MGVKDLLTSLPLSSQNLDVVRNRKNANKKLEKPKKIYGHGVFRVQNYNFMILVKLCLFCLSVARKSTTYIYV